MMTHKKNHLLCAAGFLGLLAFFTAPLHADSDTQTLPLTFSIEPVTIVKVVSPGSTVRIGPVVPGGDTRGETLQVSIATNTETGYQVFHELRSDITSNSGGELPKDELLFSVSNGKKGGTSLVPSESPMPRDSIPIFRSPGGEDLFTIHYILSNKKLFAAGSYYGNISITLEDA